MHTDTIGSIESRIDNWARWANSYRLSHATTCGSIEHRYIAEAGEVWEAPPARIPIDSRDAWALELAWRTLPLADRMLLRAEYVMRRRSTSGWQAHRRRVCRQLHLAHRHYEAAVEAATGMLAEAAIAATLAARTR